MIHNNTIIFLFEIDLDHSRVEVAADAARFACPRGKNQSNI
jgi:hypothetical protein